MHSLPRQQEEIINNHLRQFKIDFMVLQNMQVKDSGVLEPSEEVIEIPVKTIYRKPDTTYQEGKKRREDIREYNRLRKEWEDR